MGSLIRSLATFVIVGAGMVLIIDRTLGADDQRELSVVATVLVLAALALLQLVGSVTRSHEGVLSRVPPLWAGEPHDPPATSGVAAIREWDALLIAATTGGDRARSRLGHRIEQTVGVDIADRLPRGDPTEDEVLDALADILHELEHSDDR